MLEILRGQHLSIPPTARSFPYLLSPEIEAKDHRLRFPGRAIQYVGFGGGQGAGLLSSGFAGAYLSARYESRRESTDFSLLKYLRGETDLNPPEEREGKDVEDDGLLSRVVSDLGLEKLLDMSLGNLSNGQTRRAKIARALLGRPEVLLLDEPFSPWHCFFFVEKSSWLTLNSGVGSPDACDAVHETGTACEDCPPSAHHRFTTARPGS